MEIICFSLSHSFICSKLLCKGKGIYIKRGSIFVAKTIGSPSSLLPVSSLAAPHPVKQILKKLIKTKKYIKTYSNWGFSRLGDTRRNAGGSRRRSAGSKQAASTRRCWSRRKHMRVGLEERKEAKELRYNKGKHTILPESFDYLCLLSSELGLFVWISARFLLCRDRVGPASTMRSFSLGLFPHPCSPWCIIWYSTTPLHMHNIYVYAYTYLRMFTFLSH